MSKLQQLLDQKFPITDATSDDGKRLYEVWRDIFAEGYNAAMEEIGGVPAKQENKVDIDKLLQKCRLLIKHGRKIDAIATYRRDTGASVTEAKNVLNL